MAEILLCRVDDRLIHGQVMTTWLQYSGGNHILVVDDPTAADEFTSSIMRMSVPAGIGLDVTSTRDAPGVIAAAGNARMVLLARGPGTFLELLEAGVAIKQVIIGGMGSSRERSRFYRNIQASPQERDQMRALVAHGVDVTIWIVPTDKSIPVSKLL